MISNDLLKGSLKTIILKVLKEEGPMHGYLLTQRVEDISAGKIKLTFGALYPILHKLQQEKVLVATRDIRSNRMRIYYALTPKGQSVVEKKIEEMKEFIESLETILKTKPGLSHA